MSLLTFVVFFAGCKKSDSITTENELTENLATSENAFGKISAAAARNQQNIIFESGFEGANPFTGFDNQQHCCTYSVTQNTTLAREGSSSFKADIRTGDATTSGGYRAEIIPSFTSPTEVWYGYSTYFQNWAASGGGEQPVQWAPNNSTGSSVLSIWSNEGKFMVVRNPSGTNQNTYQSNPMTIVPNKWYDFVWHIKWSGGSDGKIELWIDGVMYFTYTGQTYVSGVPVFRLGLNRWDNASPARVLYYDNLRIGNALAVYDDVKPGSSTGPANQSPVVSAGPGRTITLPTNFVTLTATASDPDGTIASYKWTKLSGPSAVIRSSTAMTSRMQNLVAGSYVFGMTVTDNQGATANTTVNVTVNPAGSTNQSPVVTTGSDQTITLPVSSVTLTGSATDADGTIASYLWTKVSGPTGGTIASPNNATTTVTGLIAGSYVFNLKATDNLGATGNKSVGVTVNPAAGGGFGTLNFQTGYDNASDVNTQQGPRNTVSFTHYKTGPGSFRSEVRADDASTSNGFRGEMSYYGLTYNPTEGVIEYDVYYENWQNWGNDGGHSVQWHPNNGTGSATLALYNYDGKWKVTRNLGGSNFHQTGTLQTIAPNTWYKLRWEIKWSAASDGYFRMYINNVLYYTYSGITMNSATGVPYLKLGQNRWAMDPGENTVVYYDNLKIYKK